MFEIYFSVDHCFQPLLSKSSSLVSHTLYLVINSALLIALNKFVFNSKGGSETFIIFDETFKKIKVFSGSYFWEKLGKSEDWVRIPLLNYFLDFSHQYLRNVQIIFSSRLTRFKPIFPFYTIWKYFWEQYTWYFWEQ